MRVCVIGHGNMGKRHARVARSLGHFVVTVDPDPGARATLLDNKLPVGFDAAVIAVPIPKLADCARRALMLGMDVLLEKPGAESQRELADLHALAAERGLRVFVGYTERFNPVVSLAAELLGRVGTVVHVNARRLGDAPHAHAPLLDLIVHDLDALDYLGFHLMPMYSVADHRHASVNGFADSATFTVEAAHVYPAKTRTLEIVGEDATVLLDYATQQVAYIGRDGMTQRFADDPVEPLVREWQAFAEGQISTGLAALTAVQQAGNLAANLTTK